MSPPLDGIYPASVARQAQEPGLEERAQLKVGERRLNGVQLVLYVNGDLIHAMHGQNAGDATRIERRILYSPEVQLPSQLAIESASRNPDNIRTVQLL